MKTTENYGLKLPELSDPASITPLNENAQVIDAALAGRVMMACGSYRGNNSLTVTIETPGFTPQVVLMRTQGDWCDGGVNYYQSMAVRNGWCLWMGEESMTLPESEYPSTAFDEIVFTAREGALSWSMDSTGTYAKNAVNNNSGHTYQWVALGVAKK